MAASSRHFCPPLSLRLSEHTLGLRHRTHPVPSAGAEDMLRERLEMLIKDSAERTARHLEKREAVLRYLAREIWSDFATINRLFGFKNHRGLYDLLNKLVATGALKKHRVDRLILWSLSGKALSGLSVNTLSTRLARQNARMSFEAMGAMDWQNSSSIVLPAALKYKPAAVMTLGGQPVAVEIHTRLRTPKRYKELLKHHLLARKMQAWHTVFFVVPSVNQRNAIRVIVKNITDIIVDGVRYPLEPKHYAMFRYVTLEELKS